MPQDPDEDVESLTGRALEHLRAAETALECTDRGEMDRQIEQCRHMELSCNLQQQIAILKGDAPGLKYAGEQATKWATNMRAATTKRKNDIVPELVKAVTAGASWAEAVKNLKLQEVD